VQRHDDPLVDAGDPAADGQRRGHGRSVAGLVQRERGVSAPDDLPRCVASRADLGQVQVGGGMRAAVRQPKADDDVRVVAVDG
jgi:hypothetical protein